MPKHPQLTEAHIASMAHSCMLCRAADSPRLVSPGMPQRSVSLLFGHVTVEGPLLRFAALVSRPCSTTMPEWRALRCAELAAVLRDKTLP